MGVEIFLTVFLAFSAVVSSVSSSGVSLTELDALTWTLSNTDGSIRVPASIPGEVHTALIHADILSGDPYFRYNELNMSWVALEERWVYESSPFDHSSSGADGNADGSGQEGATWYVKLKGVDSIASVYLNGELVGQTDNVFRTFTFSVRGMLQPEDNVFMIVLHGVTQYVHGRAAAYPYGVPETENYNVWAEPSHRNFVRKPGSGQSVSQ